MVTASLSELKELFPRKSRSPAVRRLAFGAMALAISTDAAAFTRPAPWLSTLCNLLANVAPGKACAVRSSAALVIAGVRDLLACSINATVPATTGAAKDVPEYLK